MAKTILTVNGTIYCVTHLAMKFSVQNLLLWRNPRVSGIMLGLGLLVLLALSFYNVLVVITCLAIPLVVTTLSVRAMYSAKCALLKQQGENPFQHWLDEGWKIGDQRMDSINRRIADLTNTIVLEVKRNVLVEDFVDSLKSLLFLYLWYYIGKNISGLTLLFLGLVGLFTVPKIYDIYRKEIDGAIKQMRLKYEDFYSRLIDRIPGTKKRNFKNATDNGVHVQNKESVNKEDKRD